MSRILSLPFTEQALAMLKQAIQTGEVLVFPTETVYGIGGNALHLPTVQRIFTLKQRSQTKPFPLLITPQWFNLVSLSPSVQKLIQACWPGPLTIIAPAQPNVPQFLLGPQHTIAVRYSDSKIVNQLIELGSCPLIGTSANRSGLPECQSLTEAQIQFTGETIYWIDAGLIQDSLPSTILDCTQEPFQVIRKGAFALERLRPWLDEVV